MIKYRKGAKMFDKALKMIENIKKNDYLTAEEAWFAGELRALMEFIEEEFGSREN